MLLQFFCFFCFVGEVFGNVFFDVDVFVYVNYFFLSVVQVVYFVFFRQGMYFFYIEGFGQQGFFDVQVDYVYDLFLIVFFCQNVVQQFCCGEGVIQCVVVGIGFLVYLFDEVVQIVGWQFWESFVVQVDCVQVFLGIGIVQLFEFFFQEVVVKVYIMCYENGVFCYFYYFLGYFVEFGCILYYFLCNVCQLCDVVGDVVFGVD